MSRDRRMASLDENIEDVTPKEPKEITGLENDGPLEKQTLRERLTGLTELVPASVVNFTTSVGRATKSGIKKLFNISESAIWIAASSSLLLFSPLILEIERAQLKESQRKQQKQFLLGPNARIMSGNLSPNISMTS